MGLARCLPVCASDRSDHISLSRNIKQQTALPVQHGLMLRRFSVSYNGRKPLEVMMKKVLLPLLSSAFLFVSVFSTTSATSVLAKGKNSSTAAAVTTAASTKSDKKDSSLKITNITSPIKGGADATVSVTTEPNAMCTITVKYRSGPATAAGLKSQRADKDGKASWTWKVGKNTAVGEWPVDVTSSLKGSKGKASTTLKIEK
jgi:hypothetical protein